MTAEGFCELAVLSRYTSGLPCTWRDRIGKSLRISAAVLVGVEVLASPPFAVIDMLSEVSILNLISFHSFRDVGGVLSHLMPHLPHPTRLILHYLHLFFCRLFIKLSPV